MPSRRLSTNTHRLAVAAEVAASVFFFSNDDQDEGEARARVLNFVYEIRHLPIRFPIFRKYFQKHGKPEADGSHSISTKSLTNYDLRWRAVRGIGIAYITGAHP